LKEQFLHYLWLNNLYKTDGLQTIDNQPIKVIHPGFYNQDAGADFCQAKLQIDGLIWVGNVEIHVNSSDWYKHQHQNDENYRNVILHVVYHYDKPVSHQNGEIIPTLVLDFDQLMWENYQQLEKHNPHWVACELFLKEVDSFAISHWKTALSVDRLSQKATRIEDDLKTNNGDWAQTFYRQLARGLGSSLNGQNFEELAAIIPISILAKHRGSITQIEALLFGQSGLLQIIDNEDEYSSLLLREYEFLKSKYSLAPMNGNLWKFMRTRPVNFPTIRISQLAQIIDREQHLFDKCVANYKKENLKIFEDITSSDYWETHYTFGKISTKRKKSLGNTTVEHLQINLIAPFLMAYAMHSEHEELRDKALEILEANPSENNFITTGWEKLGIESKNAFDSQALIQLKKEYCDQRKCLQCQIGNKIIRREKYTI